MKQPACFPSGVRKVLAWSLVALSAASVPLDNVADLNVERFFFARASCAWDDAGF